MLMVTCLANNSFCRREIPILSQGKTTYNSFHDHASNTRQGNLSLKSLFRAKLGLFEGIPIQFLLPRLFFQHLHERIISKAFLLLIEVRVGRSLSTINIFLTCSTPMKHELQVFGDASLLQE